MSQTTLDRADHTTGQSPMVFVVDDNKLLVDFAVAVLESSGCQARGFDDPRDVLKAMDSTKPDLLVTDYDMPPMNGLQLIMNSRTLQPELKALLLSGTVDSSILNKHPANVHHFLAKPYQPGQLTGLVHELLS